jgi:hypothetical protein
VLPPPPAAAWQAVPPPPPPPIPTEGGAIYAPPGARPWMGGMGVARKLALLNIDDSMTGGM